MIGEVRTTLELTAPLMFPLPMKIIRGQKGSKGVEEGTRKELTN